MTKIKLINGKITNAFETQMNWNGSGLGEILFERHDRWYKNLIVSFFNIVKLNNFSLFFIYVGISFALVCNIKPPAHGFHGCKFDAVFSGILTQFWAIITNVVPLQHTAEHFDYGEDIRNKSKTMTMTVQTKFII